MPRTAAIVASSGYLILAIAQLAIGAAAIFARYALTGSGPFAVSALRLGIIGIPLALVALARRTAHIGRRDEWLLVAASAALALHFAAWIASLADTAVATSTLLVCTTPLWLALYERFVRRRPLPRGYPATLALAAVGIVLIAGVPSGGGRNDVRGAILAIAGAIAIGAYLEIVRSVRAGSTLAVVARTYPLAAVMLVPAALLARERPPALDAHAAWFGILAMALVSQGIGHTGMNAAVRRLSPRIVATTTLLEPVIAGVLAALVFGERLSGAAIAGSAIVLVALAIAVRGEQQFTVSPSA